MKWRTGNEKIIKILLPVVLLAGILLCSCGSSSLEVVTGCLPTPPDAKGPFYRPGAPVRSSVGTGYVLVGKVLSTEGCLPLQDAKIEIWLVGPDGEYGDDYRATVLPDKDGNYRFESNSPPAYVGWPPHIHIMVTAVGHQRLITQHYPEAGRSEARFDLVLMPLSH